MDTDSLSREVSNKVYFIKAIPRLKSRKKQELKKFGSLDLVPSDHHSQEEKQMKTETSILEELGNFLSFEDKEFQR
jgi:hypothetical protein